MEAEAFGCEVDFPEGELPRVIGELEADTETINALQVPPVSAGRVPVFIKAMDDGGG